MRLQTDDGLYGLGEATVLKEWGGDFGRHYGETPDTTISIIRDYLFPSIKDIHPFDLETIHERMDTLVKGYPYAKAAIDIALHDLKGKALGCPVYHLLGGLYRREIAIGHSIGLMHIEDAVTEAVQVTEDGVTTLKIKIGLDPVRDVQIVKEVRAAVGPAISLWVDANQAYKNPKLAIKVLKEMEEYRISLVEQPTEGLEAMATVARAIDTPVMADESAWTPQDVLDIIRLGAADAISIYTTKPGGLHNALKVARVAEAAGLACNVGGSAETGVGNAANLHLAASIKAVNLPCVIPITTLEGETHGRKAAGYKYLDDIITKTFGYNSGYQFVPEGPGLGIELNYEKLSRYRV